VSLEVPYHRSLHAACLYSDELTAFALAALLLVTHTYCTLHTHNTVEHNSYAAFAQAAVKYRESWGALPSHKIVPEICGGEYTHSAVVHCFTCVSALLTSQSALPTHSTDSAVATTCALMCD
jgi:hypothetical protein